MLKKGDEKKKLWSHIHSEHQPVGVPVSNSLYTYRWKVTRVTIDDWNWYVEYFNTRIDKSSYKVAATRLTIFLSIFPCNNKEAIANINEVPPSTNWNATWVTWTLRQSVEIARCLSSRVTLFFLFLSPLCYSYNREPRNATVSKCNYIDIRCCTVCLIIFFLRPVLGIVSFFFSSLRSFLHLARTLAPHAENNAHKRMHTRTCTHTHTHTHTCSELFVARSTRRTAWRRRR